MVSAVDRLVWALPQLDPVFTFERDNCLTGSDGSNDALPGSENANDFSFDALHAFCKYCFTLSLGRPKE